MNGDALCFFDGKPEELALYERWKRGYSLKSRTCGSR